MDPPTRIDWDYAERWRPELQYAMESWKLEDEKNLKYEDLL
jgi:hypothetical protein